MKPSVPGLLIYFLRLGSVAFGGPIAMIAMMEQEFVIKRKLLSRAQFAELYTLCKVSPGPVAFQMVLHVVRTLYTPLIALAAGTLFILPSAAMVIAFGLFLHRFENRSQVSHFLKALQVSTLAVVIASVIQFARPNVKNAGQILLVLASAVATYFYPNLEPLFILTVGCAFIFMRTRGDESLTKPREAASFGILLAIFWICFKASSFVFGTGLAVVPMLEAGFVHQLKLISLDDFLTGITLGQITPGPVVITATFLGLKAQGMWGAVAATLGIFIPPSLISLVLLPRVWEKMRGKNIAEPFTEGAILAVCGGLISSVFRLGQFVGFQSPVHLISLAALLALAMSKRIAFPLIILLGGLAVAFVSG